MKYPVIPIDTSPVLIEKIVVEIQQGIKSQLTWLDTVFGLSQALIRDGYVYPGCYDGGDEYASVLPSDRYGNFMFFRAGAEQKIISSGYGYAQLQGELSVVVYANLRSVYPSDVYRGSEQLKNDVIKVLQNYPIVEWHTISDSWEDIYRGYSVKETEGQFLMHPYMGLVVSGTTKFDTVCG